jgi:hypothetical protein
VLALYSFLSAVEMCWHCIRSLVLCRCVGTVFVPECCADVLALYSFLSAVEMC